MSGESRSVEPDPRHFDTILVGGGLQSGLIAAGLWHADPDHSVLIIEQDATLGGNHTWSFHLSDIDESFLPAIEPLIETRWSGYSVRVGRTRRTIALPYASISSSHFASVMQAKMGEHRRSRLLVNGTATRVDARSVRLHDDRVFTADVVIDSRGPDAQSRDEFQGGFQKFWGFEFELEGDWPDTNPIIMDDAIEQTDGFRFLYVLPFTRRRVMVEDTRFSNTAELDRGECLQRVQAYFKRRGVTIGRIVREENGVLPMPIDHRHRPSVERDQDRPIRGGYAGGWFHAATGYSFPLAAAFAQTVASVIPRVQGTKRDLNTGDRDRALRDALGSLAERQTFQASFGRFLNRLLFKLVRPSARFQIFQRFYRVLPEDRIARFYSHRFRRSDAARIVIGMPPTGLQPIEFIRSFGTANRAMQKSVSSLSNPKIGEVTP